jgi:hypothetical protein
MTVKKFEQIVVFTPAYDKRTNNPKTNAGIGSVEIYFVLKGPKGAVHFSVMTNWFLPHNIEENRKLLTDLRELLGKPMGISIGYHSPKPMREGQQARKCSWLCEQGYCDSTSLTADEWVNKYLLPGGSDEVWKQLRKEYDRNFRGR